jgi:hypothetical protein
VLIGSLLDPLLVATRRLRVGQRKIIAAKLRGEIIFVVPTRRIASKGLSPVTRTSAPDAAAIASK